MAQTTSELWKSLWRAKGTKKEYGFDINGAWYGPEEEVEHSVDSGLYEEFGIGNATIAQLSISLCADDIPRGATIKRYIRLKNRDRVSEWLPKGIFFTNRRAEDDGYWTIEAFDSMRKAEAVWEPDQSLEFPLSMPDAVAEFARIMGVEIDARTVLNPAYTIDYPANEYTIRNELCYIAAAHGGNWIITDAGKLLLIPLVSIPGETSYLVTEHGAAITLGGVKILTSAAAQQANSASADKSFVGLDITGFANNGKKRPISRVTLLVDNDNAITAGDDTGIEISADCPHATQAMVDAILAQVKGYQYQMYSGDDANLDPAAELGDGATVSGIYSVIARIDDDGSGYAGISAPGEEELEDEYPAPGPMTQEFNRQLAQTRSQITKTAEQIRLEVADEVEGLSSSFEVELGEISARIDGAEESIEVAITTLDGLTVTDSGGTTKIKGSSVETDTLYVNAANINGTLTASQINLTGAISWSDLATDAKSQVTSAQTAANNAQSTANSAASTASSAASTASSAVSTASSAYSLANSANNTVSSWKYSGTTYIDGAMLMTGTVKASSLQGGSISLLNSSGNTSGTITLTSATTASYAVDITSNAALRLTASSGAIYLTNGFSQAYLGTAYRSWVVQNCLPVADNAWNCGSAGYRWANVYASTAAIQTSDRNQKHDIEPLPDKYLDMLLELPVYRFKMNGGTSDRYHVGYLAQDVEEYMDKHGIDSLEFGGFVKDVDEDGKEIYMLRYEEFIAIHTLAVQRIYQKLEAAGL